MISVALGVKKENTRTFPATKRLTNPTTERVGNLTSAIVRPLLVNLLVNLNRATVSATRVVTAVTIPTTINTPVGTAEGNHSQPSTVAISNVPERTASKRGVVTEAAAVFTGLPLDYVNGLSGS